MTFPERKIVWLIEAAAIYLRRVDLFLDRRLPDDGPDWEYTKLHNAAENLREAIKDLDEFRREK